MNSTNKFIIRDAQTSDLDIIISFIKLLADYEKLLESVKLNKEKLHSYLFGKTPKAEVIIAEENNKPIGFALFFHNFSTFEGRPGLYLEDLFILPEHRSKGYGKKLLKYLANIAIERDCARFEWCVLDWNRPSIKFYEKQGALAQNDWLIYRLDGSKLESFAQNLD